eukprot:symbB.v1.2.032721.t1/scaffold3965.1/size47353/1
MVMALQKEHVNTACADFFPGENLLAPQVKNTFIHFDLLLFDFDLEPESCLLRTKSCPDLTPAYCAWGLRRTRVATHESLEWSVSRCLTKASADGVRHRRKKEPRAKPAKKLVASLLRKQPMECDLEHLKFQKINDSPIYWNSPVQAKKKEVAGRISWQSSLGDAGYEVDLGIQFDDEAFKGQGYKRKPGQDEVRVLMQFMIQGMGEKKLVLRNPYNPCRTTMLGREAAPSGLHDMPEQRALIPSDKIQLAVDDLAAGSAAAEPTAPAQTEGSEAAGSAAARPPRGREGRGRAGKSVNRKVDKKVYYEAQDLYRQYWGSRQTSRIKYEDATREYCEELLDHYNWHFSIGPYAPVEEVVEEEPVGTDQPEGAGSTASAETATDRVVVTGSEFLGSGTAEAVVLTPRQRKAHCLDGRL